jgi:glycosyltransferase involved in cell wall biosynthesis
MRASLGVITEQLQNYGGSEIYLLECMRRWQHEIDVVVYTTQFNPELFAEYGIDGDRVRVHMLKQIESEKVRFSLLDELVIGPRLWERQIGQHDLYFHYLFPTQFVRKSPSVWFAAEPLRMLYDLRHLKNIDSSMTTFHVYPRMEYDTASKSDLNVMLQVLEELDQSSSFETLVTNSRMMDGYLETIYGKRADLIAYPGINLPETFDGPVDNRTALYVGRFWSHKRIDLILESLALVEDGKLIIVGGGAEKAQLTQMVESLGLKERVTFLSNLDNEQLDRVFRSVTCGIYTPVREPFGIMPLEAASHGLPVIITPDGGYTEVLDSSCGHIVDPEPARVAEALESLFSNHAMAREMGAAGRKKVEQYTWDHTAKGLLNLFKRKLADRRITRSSRGCRPLLGAHYYPWYEAGETVRHWNENTDYATVDDLPEQGIYSSDDCDVIARHLELVDEAGLDYLVINLQVSGSGLDPRELRAVDTLFEMTADRSPDLSLCFMVTCDKADSQSIDASLTWLDEHYLDHPSYLRLDSKPVLWFFVTESFIGHFFYNYASFSESTRDYHRVAAAGFCFSKCLPNHYGEFFDGWSLYSPLQIAATDECEALWDSSYREFTEVKAGRGLGVFTICPGFDDTGLTHSHRPNSDHRTIARNETDTYARMQEACIGLHDRADLVVITSFNEFHENTHIEPSEAFGRQYIGATQCFSEKLKSTGSWDPRETSGVSSEPIKSVV